MVRVAVHGAAGRMGREVLLAAFGASDVEVVEAAARPGSPSVGQDIGDLAGAGPICLAVTDSLDQAVESADVLVDFSTPDAITAAWPALVSAGTPTVSGTTGLSPEQLRAVSDASGSIPVFHAPNTSVGVNLLLSLLSQAAAAMSEGYDIEIVETHHRNKKDAPSGTAIRIGEVIAEATGGEFDARAVYGREGLAPRQPREIGIHALRGGAVVGEHRIQFISDSEQIELVHTTFSRRTFADGAIRAAKFLAGKPAGLYGMEQMLLERE